MIYRVITILLWPVFFLYTLKISLRYKSLTYFKQRLGFSFPDFVKSPIWIHCASVGEVNTFLPLLELLQINYPQQHFLITTNTPTGAFIVNKNKLLNTKHCYLPIDTYGSVSRFIKAIKPSIAIVMETELWPLLYQQCHSNHIPIAIINGRLSHKTLNTSNWIKQQYKASLNLVDKILVRNDQEKNNFIQLGASPEKLEVLGNLKFSLHISDSENQLDNFTSRPYILAASTHDNEELQLAQLWKKLQPDNHLLVIAPRHPERTRSILQQLAPLDLDIAVRSKQQTITSTTDIYLADTVGELVSFMRGADIVFMGGSLVPHGGQNLLEPAYLGKAIITGPHYFNFQSEVELLIANNGCLEVTTTEELGDNLLHLLGNKSQKESLEKNAAAVMQSATQVASRYFRRLDELYRSYLNN